MFGARFGTRLVTLARPVHFSNDMNQIIADARNTLWRIKLPPQPQIILAFVDPPDVVGAVVCFVDEVPASVEICVDVLHLSGCKARAAVAACQHLYGRDSQGVHRVPKRSLDEIIISAE